MARTWATVKDLADFYRLSQSTVRNKVRSGEWPAQRVGSGKRPMIRFTPEQQDEIESIIRAGHRATGSLDWLDSALDKLSA